MTNPYNNKILIKIASRSQLRINVCSKSIQKGQTQINIHIYSPNPNKKI